jgi:hypothetical protein
MYLHGAAVLLVIFYINNLIHILAILLNGLIVGLPDLNIGYIPDFHLFAAFWQALHYRASSRRNDRVSFITLFVIGPPVIIVVGGLIDDHSLGSGGKGGDGCADGSGHYGVTTAACHIIHSLVIMVLLVCNSHNNCSCRQGGDEKAPRMPHGPVIEWFIWMIGIGMITIIGMAAIGIRRPRVRPWIGYHDGAFIYINIDIFAVVDINIGLVVVNVDIVASLDVLIPAGWFLLFIGRWF